MIIIIVESMLLCICYLISSSLIYSYSAMISLRLLYFECGLSFQLRIVYCRMMLSNSLISSLSSFQLDWGFRCSLSPSYGNCARYRVVQAELSSMLRTCRSRSESCVNLGEELVDLCLKPVRESFNPIVYLFYFL